MKQPAQRDFSTIFKYNYSVDRTERHHFINAYYCIAIYASSLYLRLFWDIPHLIDSLSSRDYDHSSSRIASGDSASLVPVSVSGGARTGLIDPPLANSFTSAAAALACMRPSEASLRVNCAISESYLSHSGIFRARSSFGSFCGLCQSDSFIPGRHEPSADSGRGQWSWPCVAYPCCLKNSYNSNLT